MKALIYKLTSPSGKFYIGSTTTSLKQRVSVHYSQLKHQKHANFILQQVWNKYETLEESILEEFEYDELQEVIKKEQEWLDKLKPTYNLCKRAFVQEMTPEIREKISNSLKGKKHSQERCEAIRLGQERGKAAAEAEGRPWKVFLNSEKQKEHMNKLVRSQSKAVIMFSFEGYTLFNSRAEAIRYTQLNETSLARSIRTGLPTREGLWFVYVD